MTEEPESEQKINSANFEETVSSILCGLGAQKYIELFK